ncbi:acyl-homoserine-lactone acylase [Lentzea albidocapillata subsp. violacea]|uniref:Acyl-homoserine-lactone acylase n=1 Tax=Lentzea albidocapillata subsp. violacea TaxID=128104 RepID=A0A1G8QSZ5_9PSEU|nr:acyl-homoserine-lactone acylase [Lentzea albidocapillata subsp. violacea]
MRRFIALSLAIAGVLITSPPAVAGGGTVIRRTSYGIPHVLAADYRGAGQGLGYAFAEDNACVMAEIVVTLAAERSRWFGPDGLASDLYYQRLNQSTVVERQLARGPSKQARDLVRGYVAGFNRYLTDNGLPAACATYARPITEIDVWRRVHQVAGLTGGEGFQEQLVSAQPPGSAVTAPARVATERPGSNGIALGRDATVPGTGMVLGNPHFDWDDTWRFYQHHLTIPGELNVSGAGLYGVPVVNIGHNDRLGWTHTASEAQTVTLSKLTLVPGDPTSYVVDGKAHRMIAEQVTAGGITRTLYRTPDGPVVEDDRALQWTDTSAFVLRDANHGNLQVVDQWLAIARARSVSGLHKALVRHQALPWVNTIASDATGTAYYGDVQVVPHVTDEQRTRCGVSAPIGLVVLDGSRSDCGWGTDPDAVTPGRFGPGRLPHLIRRDHVSNMNDSPWLANPAAPLTGYPSIVGDVGTERSARTRMGLDMIGSNDFTLSTLESAMFGNRNLTAEQGRAAVVEMCQANPALPANDGQLVDVRAACAALAAWPGTGDTGERSGGAYFWRSFLALTGRPGTQLWQVPFDPADAVHTPRGINADDPGVQRAFAEAVRMFASAGVAVDVPLDAVQQYEGIPIHGCRGPEGCFNVISVPGPPRPGMAPGIPHGSSFVMAVELTRNGPRMSSMLVYGQSADPASPHHTDQARLYARKQWVKGEFTEREIAANPDLSVRRLR